jgi:hypothetical protein
MRSAKKTAPSNTFTPHAVRLSKTIIARISWRGASLAIGLLTYFAQEAELECLVYYYLL